MNSGSIDHLPKQPEIYLIKNKISGNFYVGSSRSIYARVYEHINQLTKGKHHSRYLQRAWDLYGSGAFEYSVLELCTRDELITVEQKYLDALSPSYNMILTAGSNAGRICSDEERAAMSERAKRQWEQEGYREAYSQKMAELLETTDLRERMSAAGLLRHKNNPEDAEKHSKTMLEKWADPNYKEKMSKIRQETGKDPAFRELQSKIKKKAFSDPEYRMRFRNLTSEQALFVLIQRLFAVPVGEIAKELGVTKHVIKDILRNRGYKEVCRETLTVNLDLVKFED